MHIFLRILIFLLFIVFSLDSFTQLPFPGGVSNNLKLWLKADLGTSTTTNGASVASWNDQFLGAVFVGENSPTYQDDAINLFNYNPAINFTSATEDCFTGGSIIEGNTILESTVYVVHRTRSAGSGGGLFGESVSNQERFMAHYPFDNSGVAFWYNTQVNGDQWSMFDSPTLNTIELTTFEVSQVNNTRTISVNAAIASNIGIQTYLSHTGGNNPFYIGSAPEMGNTLPHFYADALIAEVIVYYGGGNLVGDRNKVESYLAIKYGVTLDNTAGGIAGDYKSSNSTIIWDASVTPNYHNDVIGIARDDEGELNQKQSHTNDDITRVYASILAIRNELNNANLSNNESSIVVGHNNAVMSNIGAVEVPLAILNRIGREWKVTNTNFPDIYNFDLNFSNPASCDLRLLVDDDGDFTNATVYQSGDFGLAFTVNNTGVTISGVNSNHIPLNGVKYITIAHIPTVITPLTDTICQGESVMLEGLMQTTTGVYNDTLTNVNGCDSIIQTTLTVNPVVTTFDQKSICQGESILLDGVMQTISGVYNDTLSTSVGCDSIIQTTLTVNPVVTTFDQKSICQGENILLAGVMQTTSGVYNDTLSSSVGCDSIIQTTLLVNPVLTTFDQKSICQGESVWLEGELQNSSGIYVDTLSSFLGCDSIIKTTLTVNPIPIIDLGKDTVVCNDTILLNPGKGYVRYLWQDGSINATYLAVFSDVYSVSVTNIQGCSAFDEIEIIRDCPFSLFIPNTFTPDGDGVNDTFKAKGVEIEEFKMLVFDRWGLLVYKGSGIANGWNGILSSGQTAPAGIYPYVITFNYLKRKILMSVKKVGHVTLLR